MKRFILPAIVLSLSAVSPLAVHAETSDSLPLLGDASAAIVSPEKERQLGQTWLHMLRAQAPTIEDPVLLDYLDHLILRLASNSELKDPSLSLIIMDSPEINAFAAPGGIIGVNAGLFIHARNENELSAVIAHELAHMSQRHFARSIESQQKAGYAGMAALLASVVLAATTGVDAGMAALATTQAGLIDQQLRFSRHNETEADEIGMLTLKRAGLSPNSMADFFEQMQKANRYAGSRPPEFLLTHPITEARITESRARAVRFGPSQPHDSLEYQLMRQRVMAHYTKDPVTYIKQLEQQKSASQDNEAIRYGLAMTYMRQAQHDKAETEVKALLGRRPERLTYQLAQAEILMSRRDHTAAINLLTRCYNTSPDNIPVMVMLAEAQLRGGDPADAVTLLRKVIRTSQYAPHLWNTLAEAYGKSGDRLGVYQSQAEFFYEHGMLIKAEEQLRFALPLAERNFETSARLQNRLQELEQARKQQQEL